MDLGLVLALSADFALELGARLLVVTRTCLLIPRKPECQYYSCVDLPRPGPGPSPHETGGMYITPSVRAKLAQYVHVNMALLSRLPPRPMLA